MQLHKIISIMITVQKEIQLLSWNFEINYSYRIKFQLRINTDIDDFHGACAVKGNVPVVGHVELIDNVDAFDA